MPMEPHTVWFKSNDLKWNQINNVIGWVIAFPLIANGWYRDKPPGVPGSAVVTGAVLDDGSIVVQSNPKVIGGGVTPAIVETQPGVSDDTLLTLVSPSSIAQDDDFLHTALRYIIAPHAMVFFQTDDPGSPPLPDATTFTTERPAVPPDMGGFFPIIEGDCAFPWTDNCGISNCPPQDWVVYAPSS